MPKPRRVYIETYGCQMNLNDSEVMAGILSRSGYRIVGSPDEADVILLNTCAVREHAERRVFGRLVHLKRYKLRNPNLILGICGCMAQHLGERIAERAPFVDLILGPDAYRSLPDAIERAYRDEPYLNLRLDHSELYEEVEPIREKGVRAWVTIMRGCNKFCTFCIVPFVRGRERSRPFESILDEVKALADEGYREIVLLGQNVNSYDDGEHNFADLLEGVVQVEGVLRIRFTAPYPSDMTDDVIEVMASHDNICKHVHLPLQAGSDRILKLMRRGYTSEEFLELVHKLRGRMPGIGLSTDVIVGFPTETEEDFRATYEMMERIRFDSAFTFKYSPREGSIASKRFRDDVPEEVKSRRLTEIIELQERISREKNSAFIGKRVEVLVEGRSKKGENDLFGKTDDFRTTVFPNDGSTPGEMVEVLIKRATSHTLIGESVCGR
jgi:tRNA-2-methylthio-N6-dimethylallyladenosine synthase